MSETESQNLSILLPEAAVAVHSRDKDTLKVAHDLASDWRFARVKIEIKEGDAITAAKAYKDDVSPDLVIVQTDAIDDSFARQLEELAGSCDESTAAIVIGPVNDVYLYRKLIEMGVSDYLVRPVEPNVLSNVIAKTLIERKGTTGSSLIAFIGSKGGVGASSLATAAAWGAADILGHKTILLDAAGGWSTLSVAMGFEPTTTLSSAARAAAARDEDSIKRMLFKASEKLNVLASGSDSLLSGGITDVQMESIIDMLMQKYPVVVIDLSNAPSDIVRAISSRANQVVVVTTPAVASLRHARTLLQEMKNLRGKDGKNIELIINKVGISPGNEMSRKDIEQALEFKVSASIPYATKSFMTSESESKKLGADKDGLTIVRSLLPVLQKVLSGEEAVQEVSSSGGGFLDSLLVSLKIKKA